MNNELLPTQNPCLSETTLKLYEALEIDPENFSEGASRLLECANNDDIVTARRHISAQVVNVWTSHKFLPDSQSLRESAMDFALRGNREAQGEYNGETVVFWKEIGTAIFGAQRETVQDGRRVDTQPITSDGLFHNSRQIRDRFAREFEDRLKASRR